MQSQIEVYGQQELEAYRVFEQGYIQRNPPPVMPEIEPESKWIFWALVAIMIAGLNVSAAHTIPFFIESVPSYKLIWFLDVKHVTGLSAFVMVELAIVILSYTITRRRFLYDREKKTSPGKVSAYFRAALILVLLIAIGVNVYSTYQGGTQSSEVDLTDVRLTAAKVEAIQEQPDLAKIILLILSGLAAPVLVYIVGDALGFTVVEERAEKAKTIKDFENNRIIWREGLNAAWGQQKNKGIYKLRIPDFEVAPVRLLEKEVVPERMLIPIKEDIEGKTKYRCPSCDKLMTRQAWQNHPCRFEDVN